MSEQHNQKNEDKRRLLIPDGIIAINQAKEIIVFNDAASRITAFKEQEILSKDFRNVLITSKEDQSYIFSALEKGESYSNISLTLNRSDAKGLNVLTSITPVTQPNEGVIGVIVVFRDIEEVISLYDELQEKNKKLIEEKNKLEAIFRSKLEGTFTVNTDWEITAFNRSAERITGYKEKEVIGKRYSEVYRTMTGKEENQFNSIINDHMPLQYKEMLITRKDEQKIPVRANSAPLIDASDEQIGAVVTFQDISELKNLSDHLEERFHFENIIGQSKPMQNVYHMMDNVINTDSTVLITGNSGTGKEVVARAIHLNSERKLEPFMVVNCTAFAETLLESELFGHEKGAFTGAIKNKPGRFELAGKGTLFLDEIGDISLHVQVKLLRVIENRQFERVGGTETLELKARIITATHRNLEEEIVAGRFREDLFYRINVINIRLPSLAEHKEDIPGLVNHFMEKFRRRFKKNINNISPNSMLVINNYNWPGNIRELENVIEHAFVVCNGEVIETEHLPERLWAVLENLDFNNDKGEQESPIKIAEKQLISDMLEKFNGNRTKTANALGIDKSTLWRKMKKFRLD
jgi:PAS domain S-box-containing protein